MPSGIISVTRTSFLDDSYMAGVILHRLTLTKPSSVGLTEGNTQVSNHCVEIFSVLSFSISLLNPYERSYF